MPSPDGKEKCYIHHVKAISPTTMFTSAFEEFQKSITKEGQKLNTAEQSHYNLRSQSKEGEETKYSPLLLHHLLANIVIETHPHGKNPQYGITIYSLQSHKMVIYSMRGMYVIIVSVKFIKQYV